MFRSGVSQVTIDHGAAHPRVVPATAIRPEIPGGRPIATHERPSGPLWMPTFLGSVPSWLRCAVFLTAARIRPGRRMLVWWCCGATSALIPHAFLRRATACCPARGPVGAFGFVAPRILRDRYRTVTFLLSHLLSPVPVALITVRPGNTHATPPPSALDSPSTVCVSRGR